MQEFAGQVAVITGGASGVGRSLSFALGRRGARVVAADVDRKAMDALERDAAEAGMNLLTRRCDVTAAGD